MKVSNQKPPIYDKANELFKLEENNIHAVFTYGDTCHNPFDVELTGDLICHEGVHLEQQEGHPDVAKIWWDRYLQDPEFRIDQEAEAYGAQYKFICQSVKDKNARFRNLNQLATMLAGPMYGNSILKSEAIERIKQYAEGGFGVDN
jgi:hypothetical protein